MNLSLVTKYKCSVQENDNKELLQKTRLETWTASSDRSSRFSIFPQCCVPKRLPLPPTTSRYFTSQEPTTKGQLSLSNNIIIK